MEELQGWNAAREWFQTAAPFVLAVVIPLLVWRFRVLQDRRTRLRIFRDRTSTKAENVHKWKIYISFEDLDLGPAYAVQIREKPRGAFTFSAPNEGVRGLQNAFWLYPKTTGQRHTPPPEAPGTSHGEYIDVAWDDSIPAVCQVTLTLLRKRLPRFGKSTRGSKPVFDTLVRKTVTL